MHAAIPSLATRVRAWIDAFQRRPDVVVNAQLAPGLAAAQVASLDRRVPADLAAFATECGRLELTWAFANRDTRGYSPGAHGGRIVLRPSARFFEAAWLPAPFREMLIFDDVVAEGSGVLLSEQPDTASVAFHDSGASESLTFESVTEYITRGARHAFAWYWQRDGRDSREILDELRAHSLDRSTLPGDLVDALVAAGTPGDTAAMLVEWLGSDATLLAPGTPRPKAEPLRPRWTTTVEGATDRPVAGAATIALKTSAIVALDTGTGQVRWESPLEARSLAHTGASIVALVGARTLWWLDAATGAEQARVEADADLDTVVADGDRVVAISGPALTRMDRTTYEDVPIVPPPASRMLAWDAHTRAPRFDVELAAGTRATYASLIAPHTLIATSWLSETHRPRYGALVCGARGETLWSSALGEPGETGPGLFVESGDEDQRVWIDPATGAERHRWPLAYGVVGVREGAVVEATGEGGVVTCWDAATGARRWRVESVWADASVSEVLVHRGQIWIAHDHGLHVLALADGALVVTTARCYSQLAAAGDLIVAFDDDRAVCALAAPSVSERIG
jgi:outer membrane protein assembly factor BamB